MEFDLFLKMLMAVVPVLAFLAVFSQLDVFDLISTKVIVLLVFVGAGVAICSLGVNSVLLDNVAISFQEFSRYVAPGIEECLKAIPIIFLFHHNRLGYKLDAGIAGFAVGAGFAMVENGWFLTHLADANLASWLVRGFGTAIMHGGTTAIFALIAHEMTERQAEGGSDAYSFNFLYFIPGLGAVYIIHSAFNHFSDRPLLTMVMTFLLVPLVLFLTFAFNEKATGKWLAEDSDAHRKLLDDIKSGEFARSKAGQAIKEIVGKSIIGNLDDVFAYMKLKTELILRAEELILASQEDELTDAGEEELEMFERLMVLEGRIGPVTLMKIERHTGFSRNDLWELSQLRQHVESRYG